MSTQPDRGYAPDNLQQDIINAISVDVQGPKTYEQMEGEPIEWYLRFQKFMHMGPSRSVLSVYQQEWKAKQAPEGSEGHEKASQQVPQCVSGAWSRAIRQWDWYNRVAAYDLDLKEENHRIH